MAQITRGIEIENPTAYQNRLMGLLGDQPPLEVLARTPDVISDMVRSHSVEVFRTRPFAGKWTPNEVLGHLADTEWVFGFRIRLIFCEDRPTILGMDQDKWVAGQKRNDRDPADQLAEFSTLRRFNLGLWKLMSETELERFGQHNERGAESLKMMLRMEAGHDLTHIDQLRRYLAAAAGMNIRAEGTRPR